MASREYKGGVSGNTLLTLSEGPRCSTAQLSGGVHGVAGVGKDLKAAVGLRFAIEPSGDVACLRVRTRLGHELVGAGEVPVLSFGGPRRVAELCSGSRIAVARRVPAFGWADLLSPLQVEFLAFMTAAGSWSGAGSVVFQHGDAELVAAFDRAAIGTGDVKVERAESGEKGGRRYRVTRARGDIDWPGPNDAALLLKRHGLWHKRLAERRVPETVFALPRPALALYLGRLYSVMGSAGVQRGPRGAASARAGFSSSSAALCRDVQHLLLRLGVISRAKFLPASGAWLVAISEAENVRKFAQTVGEQALGKTGRQLGRAVAALPEVGKGRLDVIPAAAWEVIERTRVREGKTRQFVMAAGGLAYGRDNITRPRMALIAEALNDPALRELAEADVVWDRVVEVSNAAVQKTYRVEPVNGYRGFAGHILLA